LTEATLDGLLSSSSQEDLPLILINMLQAARLAMGTLQEAVVVLLWANLALLILLLPLLFTTVAFLVALLALFYKMDLAWDADLMKRRYQDLRRGLNIIIYGGHHDD